MSTTQTDERTKEENRRIAREGFAWIERMLENPDVRRFMAEVIERQRDAQRDIALDASKSSEECDRARQKHAALAELCREPQKLRQMYARAAGISLD